MKQRKNRGLHFGMVGVFLLVLLGIVWESEWKGKGHQKAESPVSILVPPTEPKRVLSVSKPKVTESHSHHFAPQRNWQKFLEIFGPGLVPEFSASGHFVSARGKPGEGAVGASDFSAEDSQKAIIRARQVITEARDLLELRPDWPLENAAARSSSVSAQVYFNETHQGIQVMPLGGVKVDLGSHGELLGIDSDYASHLHVTNRVILDSDQAKQKVPVSLLQPLDSAMHSSPALPNLPVDGGAQVIWMVGEKEGRIAYQFSRGGHEVVIDAESGKVLSTRDRRVY